MQPSKQPVVVTFPTPRPPARPVATSRPASVKTPSAARTPIGEMLVQSGALSQSDLLKAVALRNREETRIGNILLNHGMVTEADLFGALSQQFGATLIDLQETPPNPNLVDMLDLDLCLAENILPWRHIGGALVIVTSRLDRFEQLRADYPEQLGSALMSIAPEYDIQNALVETNRAALVERAETRVPSDKSCRTWEPKRMLRITIAAVLAFALASLTLLKPAHSRCSCNPSEGQTMCSTFGQYPN